MRIPLKTSKNRLILAMKLNISLLDEFEILIVLNFFLQNFFPYFEPNPLIIRYYTVDQEVIHENNLGVGRGKTSKPNTREAVKVQLWGLGGML